MVSCARWTMPQLASSVGMWVGSHESPCPVDRANDLNATSPMSHVFLSMLWKVRRRYAQVILMKHILILSFNRLGKRLIASMKSNPSVIGTCDGALQHVYWTHGRCLRYVLVDTPTAASNVLTNGSLHHSGSGKVPRRPTEVFIMPFHWPSEL